MLSNCKYCQYYTEPIHTGDLACAIAPSYIQMWMNLQALPSNAIANFPIDSCTEFERRLPYQLDHPCLRRSPQGNWNYMARIRNGWGETSIEYQSLAELLTAQQVSIAGCYGDETGEFFTIEPTKPHSSRSTPPAISVDSRRQQALDIADRAFFISVDSSHIDAIGYDLSSQILLIRFYDSGLYAYFNVPTTVWYELQNAPSKGRFRHQHIKGRYDYLRI